MDSTMITYLQWRCRRDCHNKYFRYIDEWIANVTKTQLDYFIREREHLINNGEYSG